jgi:hypothetical protein
MDIMSPDVKERRIEPRSLILATYLHQFSKRFVDEVIPTLPSTVWIRLALYVDLL